jgi:thiamine biosynthesis lipoprotein
MNLFLRQRHSRYACLHPWWLVLLCAISVSACQPAPPVQHSERRPLMGTLVDITVEGPNEAVLVTATDAAFVEMSRLSDMMNHYNPDSVVSAVNREAGGKPVRVPPELMQVLLRAQDVSRRSGGAFDISVGGLRGWRFDPAQPRRPEAAQIRAQLPLVDYRNIVLDPTAGTAFLRRRGMRIDLGGIAKLYILDAGMTVLKHHHVAHAMINGGGDVAVMGTIRGRPWHVGIRDPQRPDQLYGVVEVTRGYVVSSGDYERFFLQDGHRYHHILDPKTGYPTEGPHGVTLLCDDLDTVNGLSAAIMVLGDERGRRLLQQTSGLEGIIFQRDGTVWVSPGMTQRLRRVAPAT